MITIIVNNTIKIEKIRDYFLNSIQNFHQNFMSKRRYTKTQFKEELEKMWEKNGLTNLELVNFDTSNETMSMNDKFEVHCKIHDYTFTRSARKLLCDKSNCDKCRREKQSRENTISKEFLRRVKKQHGDNSQYDYEKTMETYTGITKPLTVYCTKHGPYQLKRAFGFLHNGRSECRAEYIGDLTRRTLEEFISEAESNGIYLLTIPYVDLDRIPEILEEFLGPTHNNITTVLHPKLLPILYGQD